MPDQNDSFSKRLFGKGNTLWGFAEGVQAGDSVSLIRFVWGRIAIFIVILLLLGWTGAMTAAWGFNRYVREFRTVTYWQVLFPWEWDARRVQQGNELIERAKNLVREQRGREAFFLLRSGVNLAPANTEGRLLLAQFHTVLGRQDLALELMVSGLKGNEENVEYLQSLFQTLIQFQEDLLAHRLATGLLPKTIEITPRTQLLALAAATAKFHRGNYDAAEDLVNQYNLLRTKEGWPLMARIDWERGYRELAVARLEQFLASNPAEDAIYVMLTNFYREMGQDTKAESTAVLRQLRNPDIPSPRIGLLYAYYEKNDTARLNQTLESFFREFSRNRDALWSLADFAANTGNIALAERVVQVCQANGLPSEGPRLMHIEAAVVARQYTKALEMLETLQRDSPRLVSQFSAVFTGLQTIANLGAGNREAAELYLSQFLTQAHIRVESLLAVSNRLLSLGAREQARRVLEQASRADPFNQAALTNLVAVDLELGNTTDLGSNLGRLVAMRKPSVQILERALNDLGSDAFLFLDDRNTLLAGLRTAVAQGRELERQAQQNRNRFL